MDFCYLDMRMKGEGRLGAVVTPLHVLHDGVVLLLHVLLQRSLVHKLGSTVVQYTFHLKNVAFLTLSRKFNAKLTIYICGLARIIGDPVNHQL